MCSHCHIGSRASQCLSISSMVMVMRTGVSASSSSCPFTSFSSSSSTSSWFLPWCLMTTPWITPCATPPSGAWSPLTMSHPTHSVHTPSCSSLLVLDELEIPKQKISKTTMKGWSQWWSGLHRFPCCYAISLTLIPPILVSPPTRVPYLPLIVPTWRTPPRWAWWPDWRWWWWWCLLAFWFLRLCKVLRPVKTETSWEFLHFRIQCVVLAGPWC